MEIPLDQPVLRLGRGPGADLAFDDPELSRVHAVLEITHGGYQVRDLGSATGTRLNGRPVLQPTSLRDGDRLSLGAQELELAIAPRSDAGLERAEPRTTGSSARVSPAEAACVSKTISLPSPADSSRIETLRPSLRASSTKARGRASL